MKLKTNFFLTICQREFPQIQVFINPESFDEGYNRSSGLTHTLIEYLGMRGSSIAGSGQELDDLVKMQGTNGLKLEETTKDGSVTKVHIFYVSDDCLQTNALFAAQEMVHNLIKERLEMFRFHNAG